MIYKISSEDEVIDWNATGNDRIVQNVLNIIRTKKYEVPFMRLMGISPDYIDEALNGYRADIINDVIENINTYEPRVEVLNVDISISNPNGDIEITVELEV